MQSSIQKPVAPPEACSMAASVASLRWSLKSLEAIISSKFCYWSLHPHVSWNLLSRSTASGDPSDFWILSNLVSPSPSSETLILPPLGILVGFGASISGGLKSTFTFQNSVKPLLVHLFQPQTKFIIFNFNDLPPESHFQCSNWIVTSRSWKPMDFDRNLYSPKLQVRELKSWSTKNLKPINANWIYNIL